MNIRNLVSVLLSAMILSSCSAPDDSGAEPGAAPNDVQSSAASLESEVANPLDVCDGRSAQCVRISGQRVAILYRGKSALQGRRSKGVVLWNPGGPGLTPPPVGVRDVGLPRALEDYDLLYLVEPWNLQDLNASCLRFEAEDRAGCDLKSLSWSSGETIKVVKRTEAITGVEFAGVYALSFGATASAGLIEEVTRDGSWVIFENPAPPPGTSLDSIVESREKAVLRFIASWSGCRSGDGCYARRLEKLVNWTTGRSGGNARLQASLGLVALSTDPSSNKTFLDLLVKRLDLGLEPSSKQERALRRAGARFQLRGTEGTVQPALVGLWAGTCSAFGGLEKVGDGIAEGLASLYAGCSGQSPSAATAVSESTSILLLHGADDTVVPIEMQKRWDELVPNASSNVLPRSGHFREDDRVNALIESWIDRNVN